MLACKKILAEMEAIFFNNPAAKVALFVRHAEKEPLNPVGISAKGIIDSEEMGDYLRDVNKTVYIYSSPEYRCVQTAKIISERLYCTEIVETNFLGVPGAQIIDESAYAKLYEKYLCREIFSQWKQGLHYDIMCSPIQLKKRTIDFFKKNFKSGINLCISQSGTIASIGYALGLVDYNVAAGEWVAYLDGFSKSVY